jgi:hypothetical protein
MVTAHAKGRLDDRDGKGLTAIAEVGHVTALCLEELLGRVFAVRCNEPVEVVLYGLEVRLTVPQGVIGVESDYSEW